MTRNKTTIAAKGVPGSVGAIEDCSSGPIYVNTIGYIGQHLHDIASNEEEFTVLIKSYDFSIDELRYFLDPGKNELIPTRMKAYKKMFQQFEGDKHWRDNKTLN